MIAKSFEHSLCFGVLWRGSRSDTTCRKPPYSRRTRYWKRLTLNFPTSRQSVPKQRSASRGLIKIKLAISVVTSFNDLWLQYFWLVNGEIIIWQTLWLWIEHQYFSSPMLLAYVTSGMWENNWHSVYNTWNWIRYCLFLNRL